MSIYEDYFKHTNDYKTIYGEQTVVLMQVGAFFEVYGIKNIDTDIITGSNIEKLAEICRLNISTKAQPYGNNEQIVMAGFRDFTVDTYITQLVENGYSVPVFVQIKEDKIIKRVLDKVYSAGTYVSCETDSIAQISNTIMSIWFEVYKPSVKNRTQFDSTGTLVYGVSVVDIFTGKSSIFQHETPFYMNVTTFDELDRYVSMYTPSEIIVISPFDKSTLVTISQYTGIQSRITHFIDTRDVKNDKVSCCTNQKYLKELLSCFYKEDTFDICLEFQEHILATQSFCYLLNFIQEHNPNLVKKIHLPDFNNTSNRVVLANHTLSQLNIIGDLSEDSKKMGKLSSVMAMLNKCCSPMGKRLFQRQLMNPTFDEDWLQKEYTMVETMLEEPQYDMIELIRNQMAKLRDINKVCRQLVLKTIYPSSVSFLYSSLHHIQQMNVCLYETPDVAKYLCAGFADNIVDAKFCSYIDTITLDIHTFLDKYLHIDQCKQINSMSTFPVNIIKPGVSTELDDAVATYNNASAEFTDIHRMLNGLIRYGDKKFPDTDIIKIHETEKSGLCLQITNKRCEVLKKLLADVDKDDEEIIKLDISGRVFSLCEIKFVKAATNTMEITSPLITEISKTILYYKGVLNRLIAETYQYVLSKLEESHYDTLELISSYAAKLDVLQSKTYIARKYNYCKPMIDKPASKSGFIAKDIRHCLIEQIQQDELYVPNDISLGNVDSGNDGVLLYGTNAVGKTSLIRSIGVALIMAQTGMYVPCSSFSFKPYTAIFSRILGNDNIFKGLSTFAVEMSELRVIIKMADENSLILGDELCSGTETESALSIFVAGLMNLTQKTSSYIFATHFHEIVDYDEVIALERLAKMHMEVSYDREHDCLVYDRKLKEGSGPRIYGLEVCKSLHLDDDFLELAYDIRNKYYPETRGILSNKQSVYNAKKVKGMCEICKDHMGEEVHHLQHQQNANENGFIGTFHKNHKANLLNVCERCHDKLHHTDTDTTPVTRRKKTTKGIKLI
jgi:DNA mismatch repair protein MutS